VMPDGTKIAVTEGTPQGGPLSPNGILSVAWLWQRPVE
jgi:hypothetical protein